MFNLGEKKALILAVHKNMKIILSVGQHVLDLALRTLT